MNELTIISETIERLGSLVEKEQIFLDDIPKQFKEDLHHFIVGETLSMAEGKIIIGKNLYKRWLTKIRTLGFDYEIDFKQ